MSCWVRPAPSRASATASTASSSALRSKCSANRVQPIEMMATRSLRLCWATSASLVLGFGAVRRRGVHRAGLPEVVADAADRGAAAEGRDDLVADPDRPADVGELTLQPP